MELKREKQVSREVQISLRLPADVLEQFDQFCRVNGLSRAKALETLLSQGTIKVRPTRGLLLGLKKLRRELLENSRFLLPEAGTEATLRLPAPEVPFKSGRPKPSEGDRPGEERSELKASVVKFPQTVALESGTQADVSKPLEPDDAGNIEDIPLANEVPGGTLEAAETQPSDVGNHSIMGESVLVSQKTETEPLPSHPNSSVVRVVDNPLTSSEENTGMNINWLEKEAYARGITPLSKSKSSLIREIQKTDGFSPCFATGFSLKCEQENCLWRKECLRADSYG